MNNLKTLNPSASRPKATTNQVRNFIEALKDQAKAASFGVANQAADQLTGTRQPPTAQEQNKNQWDVNLEQLLLRERQVRLQESQLSRRQQTPETLVFYRKEEAVKKEIEVIKQEIKVLVTQTGKLSSELVEAEKSVSSRIPDIKSGIYYLSFFERIRRLIKLAQKRVTESRTWLAELTSRNKAKSYFWGQVRKSGTKFLLSQERYMATQVG